MKKQTFNFAELKVGDIIAFHEDHGFLPPKIRYFMKQWAKIHYHTKLEKYYNHTFMVTDPETLEIAEAVKKGYAVYNFYNHYSDEDLKNMLVFRLKEPLTEHQNELILKERDELAYDNIEYEKLNFFWWVLYIWSNGRIDWSPKGDKAGKRLFCFETSAKLLNSAANFFEKPDKVTTVDLQMDDRFNQYFLAKSN